MKSSVRVSPKSQALDALEDIYAQLEAPLSPYQQAKLRGAVTHVIALVQGIQELQRVRKAKELPERSPEAGDGESGAGA